MCGVNNVAHMVKGFIGLVSGVCSGDRTVKISADPRWSTSFSALSLSIFLSRFSRFLVPSKAFNFPYHMRISPPSSTHTQASNCLHQLATVVCECRSLYSHYKMIWCEEQAAAPWCWLSLTGQSTAADVHWGKDRYTPALAAFSPPHTLTVQVNHSDAALIKWVVMGSEWLLLKPRTHPDIIPSAGLSGHWKHRSCSLSLSIKSQTAWPSGTWACLNGVIVLIIKAATLILIFCSPFFTANVWICT